MTSDVAEEPVDLFGSVWQFIDSFVLLAVHPTAQGSQTPAVMPTSYGPCVPTWVDQARAQALLAPGYKLVQTPMIDLITAEFLGPEIGIVVEPGAANALVVPGEGRVALKPRCVPFPDGARTAWGTLPENAQPLVDELTRRAKRINPLARLWMARFQVEDMRENVGVVYQEIPHPDQPDVRTDQLIVDALYAGIAKANPAYPVQVVAFTDLPDGTREWVEESVSPIYVKR